MGDLTSEWCLERAERHLRTADMYSGFEPEPSLSDIEASQRKVATAPAEPAPQPAQEAERMTYEAAETLALRAIHGPDGRGLIGRGRNHLHERVARAILDASRLGGAIQEPEEGR